mmetsp:Transcript_54286/g.128561  ORF Transcript_54286/g.128561 Transcript_54286/m.128561 type:complete len:313 (+) Transcript_54286:192-1130(+)
MGRHVSEPRGDRGYGRRRKPSHARWRPRAQQLSDPGHGQLQWHLRQFRARPGLDPARWRRHRVWSGQRCAGGGSHPATASRVHAGAAAAEAARDRSWQTRRASPRRGREPPGQAPSRLRRPSHRPHLPPVSLAPVPPDRVGPSARDSRGAGRRPAPRVAARVPVRARDHRQGQGPPRAVREPAQREAAGQGRRGVPLRVLRRHLRPGEPPPGVLQGARRRRAADRSAPVARQGGILADRVLRPPLAAHLRLGRGVQEHPLHAPGLPPPQGHAAVVQQLGAVPGVGGGRRAAFGVRLRLEEAHHHLLGQRSPR